MSKLILIPSGYKAAKLYSILPEDGTGDFIVDRGADGTGNATRTNKDGLLETVAFDVPRLDYANGSCPECLLEGQATNLIEFPITFSDAYWTKTNTTVTGGFVSPHAGFPTSAFKLESTVADGNIRRDIGAVDINTNFTYSVFLKKGSSAISRFDLRFTGGTNPNHAYTFNFDTKVFIALAIVALEVKYVEFINGWFLVSITANSGNSTSASIYLFPDPEAINHNFIAFAQLEVGSTATSLILPAVEGSTSTRLADVITVTPPVGTTSIIRTVGGIDTTTAYTSGVYTIPNGRTQKIVML